MAPHDKKGAEHDLKNKEQNDISFCIIQLPNVVNFSF